MVGIFKRMRHLQQKLLDIRLGSGAAILPPEIKRIHLEFAQKMNGGHMGPRHFWRTQLPRLKYHNPSVSMTVHRSSAAEDPAVLSIHYASPGSSSDPSASVQSTSSSSDSSPTTSENPTERIETIDMKMRTHDEIWAELVKKVRPREVTATAEERELMAELREAERKASGDRKLGLEVHRRRRREEEILAQAKRSANAA